MCWGGDANEWNEASSPFSVHMQTHEPCLLLMGFIRVIELLIWNLSPQRENHHVVSKTWSVFWEAELSLKIMCPGSFFSVNL